MVVSTMSHPQLGNLHSFGDRDRLLDRGAQLAVRALGRVPDDRGRRVGGDRHGPCWWRGGKRVGRPVVSCTGCQEKQHGEALHRAAARGRRARCATAPPASLPSTRPCHTPGHRLTNSPDVAARCGAGPASVIAHCQPHASSTHPPPRPATTGPGRSTCAGAVVMVQRRRHRRVTPVEQGSASLGTARHLRSEPAVGGMAVEDGTLHSAPTRTATSTFRRVTKEVLIDARMYRQVGHRGKPRQVGTVNLGTRPVGVQQPVGRGYCGPFRQRPSAAGGSGWTAVGSGWTAVGWPRATASSAVLAASAAASETS
jgi:hypothetical protein